MTLPAHRYLDREERKKKDKGGKVWVFDFDETITKAPDQCARIAKALRALDDTVIVVTGNQSSRNDLKKRLDGYGFEYDDLIQYQDDQTDGLNRAAILKQLDAFCGFDDRAGRGYTLAKACPHFFLVAKPPKRAEDNADGFKAKKATKRDAGLDRSERRETGSDEDAALEAAGNVTTP